MHGKKQQTLRITKRGGGAHGPPRLLPRRRLGGLDTEGTDAPPIKDTHPKRKNIHRYPFQLIITPEGMGWHFARFCCSDRQRDRQSNKLASTKTYIHYRKIINKRKLQRNSFSPTPSRLSYFQNLPNKKGRREGVSANGFIRALPDLLPTFPT